MKVRLVVAVLLATPTVLFSTPSAAWDGIKSGKITGVDVTSAQNYAFRVYMDGTPMCGTDAGWAYINKDWDNYQAMVSLITSAYLSSKPVGLYLTKVGPYCEIGYAAFR